MVKNFSAERQTAVEEKWFREREDEVFPAGAILNARAKLLPGSRKVRPVHDVEIALRQFDETNQAIDGAKAGAEIERSGPFFLDLDGEIFPAGYAGIFGISLNLRKVAQIIQALLRRFHAHAVEDVARSDQHFAPNHFIFGAGIAYDVDPLNERRPALLDLIMHVDPAAARRNALR